MSDTEKLQIVLEGLKGRIPLSELCNRYEISQTTYYKWRDILLNEGSKVFSAGKMSKKEQRLESECSKLREMVGSLTMELKNGW